MVLCPYVCQLKGLKEENYPKNNVLTDNGAATGHNFETCRFKCTFHLDILDIYLIHVRDT